MAAVSLQAVVLTAAERVPSPTSQYLARSAGGPSKALHMRLQVSRAGC